MYDIFILNLYLEFCVNYAILININLNVKSKIIEKLNCKKL